MSKTAKKDQRSICMACMEKAGKAWGNVHDSDLSEGICPRSIRERCTCEKTGERLTPTDQIHLISEGRNPL